MKLLIRSSKIVIENKFKMLSYNISVNVQTIILFISVWSGDGDIDREILASFPRCATYIGVEPRTDVLSQLQHNLEGLVETVEVFLIN